MSLNCSKCWRQKGASTSTTPRPPSFNFKDILLKVRVHSRHAATFARDATLIFPRREPYRVESLARSSGKSAANGFTFSFVKVHSYRPNPGLLPADPTFPVVSNLIDSPSSTSPPCVLGYFFSGITSTADARKIKFTKRHEFPCPYNRKGRRTVDRPRGRLCLPRILFCENTTARNNCEKETFEKQGNKRALEISSLKNTQLISNTK